MRSYKVTWMTFPKLQMTGGEEGGRTEWRLLENVWFHIDCLTLVLPAGFITDLASVPWGLWNVAPPDGAGYAPASLLHDFLCSTELFPRGMADDLFLCAMRTANVPWWKRVAMWAAVRFGAIVPNENTVITIARWRGLVNILSSVRPLWATLEEAISYAKTVNSQYFHFEG
jgi:hypothetical protein